MIAEDAPLPEVGATGALRRTGLLVAAINFAYFAVEIAAANRIGSVALYADSADFLEDAAVNTLIAIALGWSLASRARLGFVLAAIALAPGLAALWTAFLKLSAHGGVPDPQVLGWVGAGALLTNLVCAGLLVRHRRVGGSLGRAAWLCARNDAAANVAIIVAALITLRSPTIWPDLVVGLGVFVLNLDAAGDVLRAAREERGRLAA